MATQRFKNESLLRYLDAMVSEMDSVFGAFEPLYYDLADYLCPTLPQFASTDINIGDRRSTQIIDSTATLYAQGERAGMMSSITSPSRPWFRLAIRDERYNANAAIKTWLSDINQKMLTTLLLSNFYTEMMSFYDSAIYFGTAVMYVEEDLTGKVVRFKSLPIGSYRLCDDFLGRANILSRTMRYTLRQLLQEFAKTDKNGEIIWDNFSSRVKDAYDMGKDGEVFEVRHIVCPNPSYYPGSKLAKDKKWISYYWETGANRPEEGVTSEDRFLKTSGYDYFPFLVFRWSRNPGDVYATDCPGITALSDCKQLQAMEQKKLLAVEKSVDPPMIAPPGLEAGGINLMPGGITFSDGDNTSGVRPLMEMRINLTDMDAAQMRVRDRLARAFHVDLFRSISRFDEIQPGVKTATEIKALQQEGMRQLGPILEQLNDSTFGPMIDILFKYHIQQGVLPEPPTEIQGQDLKVEYISIMAQAQQLESLAGLERFLGIVSQVAAIDQQVLDVVDTDFVVREISRVLSLPPRSVHPEDEVEALRLKRSALVEAQQKAATLQQASQGLAGLAQVGTGEDSMLNQQIQQLESAGLTPSAGA